MPPGVLTVTPHRRGGQFRCRSSSDHRRNGVSTAGAGGTDPSLTFPRGAAHYHGEGTAHADGDEVSAGPGFRSDADNRSDGQGHKELMLTYQKAMKMNIPVVLIKSCNRQLCIMNLANFPISKLVRYENPELFKKIQCKKSMQLRAGSSGRIVPVQVLRQLSIVPLLHRIHKDDDLQCILKEFQ
ncbi:conserved hypothetical protein [Culex quinquefasciatus]|uniref:Uncharacterized protein n=1 Tax=Culex quinquefasciatus TaxID=7176 RepID=B0WTA3_CULQU|nr:conserved hypothetical protein [Culex quinquefasciatus]|eukprot:XP_001870853.1 conserved hypothetical protein [Culex quinquefasciatus]